MSELIQETLTLSGIIVAIILLISWFLGEVPKGSPKRKMWLLVLASPAISYVAITPLIILLLDAMDIKSFIAFGFLITILLMAYSAVIGRSITES